MQKLLPSNLSRLASPKPCFLFPVFCFFNYSNTIGIHTVPCPVCCVLLVYSRASLQFTRPAWRKGLSGTQVKTAKNRGTNLRHFCIEYLTTLLIFDVEVGGGWLKLVRIEVELKLSLVGLKFDVTLTSNG